MKTLRISLLLIGVATLCAGTLLAGPVSGTRRPGERTVPPDAVRSVRSSVCPKMVRHTGRFVRTVACTGAIAETPACRNHCSRMTAPGS